MPVDRALVEEMHAAFVRLMDAIAPERTPQRFEAARRLWQHIPAKGTPLENDPVFKPGRWPDPTQPGVPPSEGWHWVMWPETGVMMAAAWSGVGVLNRDGSDGGELNMWVQSYLGTFVEPRDMAHLDYIGEAIPPPADVVFEIDGNRRAAPRQDFRGRRETIAKRR